MYLKSFKLFSFFFNTVLEEAAVLSGSSGSAGSANSTGSTMFFGSSGSTQFNGNVGVLQN